MNVPAWPCPECLGLTDDTEGDIDEWTAGIHEGDAFDVLPELPADSVHAVVTDPPYGLAFMGRDWDDFEPQEYQAWCEDWAAETKRVLKPGGHLLAFSGNRTHHRLFTGVEDAGFEIRDTITWHYGSGFPKALDVSKAIDKRADAEREVVKTVKKTHLSTGDTNNGWSRPSHKNEDGEAKQTMDITAPATDAAEEWDGFKTGLKPATEYVVVARKPFDGATVDCVLEHGTGALNIDSCRVNSEADTSRPEGKSDLYGEYDNDDTTGGHTEGRYPSNVVFDETEAERLDREVGPRESDGIDFSETTDNQKRDKYGEYSGERTKSYVYDDNHDGPSRYFYTSKASRSERTHDGDIENTHPTVKPLDLMEWLITLVTREDQIVLDPFAGSGTTPLAAKRLGREFVAIERQPKYVSLAQARVGLDIDDPSVVRSDGAQSGLEAYSQEVQR